MGYIVTRDGAPTWKDAVKKAISNIIHTSYGSGGTGVTKDITWAHKKVLNKSETSYCSGAQFEAFIDAAKLCMLDDESGFDHEEIKDLRLGAYCRVDISDKYKDGLPGVLIENGWATEVDKNDIQYGDLIQLQFGNGNPVHAVIASDKHSSFYDNDMRTVTEHPSGNNSLVCWAWGSNYSQPARYGLKNRQSGHMEDYFTLDKPNRIFKVARPIW